MPFKINRNRPVETVTMPSGATADIEVGGLSAGDLTGLRQGLTEIEMTFSMLAGRIKRWDYVDENDQPLEITLDVMKYLPTEDYTALMEKLNQAGGLSDEENFTSSDVSKETPTSDYPPTT